MNCEYRVRLSRHRLKFEAADPQQGLFFLGTDGSTTRVAVVAKNTPRELIYLVPAELVAGQYRLELRAVFDQNDLRSNLLGATLTVS